MHQVTEGLGGTKSIITLGTDGSLTTGTVQDCTAILENAKALHNIGFTGSKDMKLAARVPFVVVEAYCNNNKIRLRDFLRSDDHRKRLLNDPALSDFRIWKGQL